MVSHEEEESQPLMAVPDPIEVEVVPVSGSGSGSEHDRSRDDATHHDSPLEDNSLQIDESDPPTPRFIQDESSWKRWKWVPYPVRRSVNWIVKWSHGPKDPQPYRIKPFFPAVQEYPLYVLDRFLPQLKHRAWLVFFYFSIWIITFALVKRRDSVASEIEGWGTPQTIGCGVTYFGAGNLCGLDGSECRPFNGSGFPFRCRANCESYHVLNPRAVGNQEVIYAPMVIGGPGTNGSDEAVYRGDSFVCAAAIHAGVISNTGGGCGVVELIGRDQDYVASKHHGISSVFFDSYFPLSFRFVPDITCSSSDSRWELLAISTVFTVVLSVCTNSPAIFFFSVFTGIFWTVGMALDPPPLSSVAALFSNLIGKFLPAMFIAWVMYDKMGVRRTLGGLTAQIEKTILWLGGCWVGGLENYTLSFIPIQRLNKHDLDQQPGARAALAIIVILLAVIISSQVWFFRQEGRLVKYLKLYALFIGAIVISLTIPGLSLRIHHYIIALLLLPGTSMQTRPSLLYQGILVGLFISGIARWGFDPVLQTSAALQGDAQKGSRLPSIPTPVINLGNGTDSLSNITFTWNEPPPQLYDGISILVNDVERFRTYFGDVDQKHEFVWDRNTSLNLPEYFRFAYMDGSDSGDYTKAGIWTSDGEWTKMKPGPSRVKARGLDKDDLVQR
ncbi:LCCL domain-containing protein [Fusarium heterosporum]|uniref:LCCL domain-containing protein n=1 Tax=Fusarium heterosporum TaxID=42747 RepID=A0A8H5T0B9_FUSHE|nr:LCCL domain-containing protein [Fusarium heterosporum]